MEDCDYDKVPWNDYRDEIKRVIVGEGVLWKNAEAFLNDVTIGVEKGFDVLSKPFRILLTSLLS